jgi:hypothetical protein
VGHLPGIVWPGQKGILQEQGEAVATPLWG